MRTNSGGRRERYRKGRSKGARYCKGSQATMGNGREKRTERGRRRMIKGAGAPLREGSLLSLEQDGESKMVASS